MPDRWGKALDEAGAGDAAEGQAPWKGRPALTGVGEKRHWWLWVEDSLIGLGTLALLVAAILHWRGVKILALPFASVLYADLAVMAVLFVLRVRRFIRVHYLERGRRPGSFEGPAGPNGRGRGAPKG